MADTLTMEYVIQGITSNGREFRPRDWSERLVGAMSCFGPHVRGKDARLQYLCHVRVAIEGTSKCVILDSRLRETEPLAFDFVLRFATDNDLIVNRPGN
ncbi:DUF3579 domain-containing protein [Paraburkholderia caribensis]|uniref:DUF3579 domain-containing protein n=1 Tax=Paraburkholderia caribensis TaxID=75105 RepID=UPI0009ED5981|nr:DUF3579 domain-containing protein [Paraburkholderia caribensis]